MAGSILSSAHFGPATLIRSSSALQRQSLLLEKYRSNPGERPDGNPLDRPVLIMQCSPTWRGQFKVADGTFAPCRETFGDLTVLPKGRLVAGRSERTCDLLYCAFDESFLAGIGDELEGKLPPPIGKRAGLTDHAVSEILNLLFAEAESGGVSGGLYFDSLANALAARFLFLGEHPPTRSRSIAILPPRKLRGVLDLIESRLAADLTLQELAAEIGYSRSHFLRMFRATTGMTPHRYVLRRRVERARQLLEQAQLSLAEVAFRCGFASQAHLTVAFRNELGVTPAEYRRHIC